MKKATYNNWIARTAWQLQKMAGLIFLLGFLSSAGPGFCSDTPALTEYQVKALFLLNFTKYVEWPSDGSAQLDSPFTIGVMGENRFGDDLKKAVAGKTVNGRNITIQQFGKEDDASKCQILFICISEKNRLAEILSKVKTMPVLTVGETDQFIQQGGIINFTKKEGKVRLAIDLDTARASKLELSSKLLAVADVVKGKVK